MNIQTIYLLLGLIGIWFSAGLVVLNIQKIAKAMRITEAFMGLTILSIATSLPEIFTHIIVSIDVLKGIDNSNIAVGTNIGSNIIQITFIMGLIGLLILVKAHKKILKIDSLVMLSSILLLFIVCLNGSVSRLEGVLLTSLYIVYMIYLTKSEKILKRDHKSYSGLFTNIFLVCLGIGILLYSAKIVVENAGFLAGVWGVRESFIGTVIIGVSTALPELTIALRAILKKSTGMSLGTLIGSNITNPLLAFGIGAIISGYSVDRIIIFFDLPFWFFVSLLAISFFRNNMKLDKHEAVVLILFYVLYVILKIIFFT